MKRLLILGFIAILGTSCSSTMVNKSFRAFGQGLRGVSPNPPSCRIIYVNDIRYKVCTGRR